MSKDTLKEILMPTTKAQHFIEVRLYYHLGGMNYFNGKEEPRGYYLSATPIEKGEYFTSFTAFTGIKCCIHHVNRRSASADMMAINIFNSYPDTMNIVNMVCERAGLELAGTKV